MLDRRPGVRACRRTLEDEDEKKTEIAGLIEGILKHDKADVNTVDGMQADGKISLDELKAALKDKGLFEKHMGQNIPDVQEAVFQKTVKSRACVVM